MKIPLGLRIVSAFIPVLLLAQAQDELLDLATTSDDRVTTYTYSDDGLVRTTKPPSYSDGGTITTDIVETYDRNGNLIYSQTKSHLNNSTTPQTHRPQTRHYYDQLNRRVRTRIATNESVADDRSGGDSSSHGTLMSSTQYDWAGQRLLGTDADGNRTKFDYDGAGRLLQVTAADMTLDATITKYEYDALGQLIGQFDGNQFGQTTPLKTTFEYDGLGRRTKRTLPSSTSVFEQWTHDFDPSTGLSSTAETRPNQVRYRDFLGREKLTTYDAVGRLDQKLKKNGAAWEELENYDYAPHGQRSQMVDNGPSVATKRTTQYAYDELSRLKVKQTPEGTVSYAYNVAGDLSEVSARHKYTFTGSTPWLFNASQQTQNNRTVGAHMSYEYDPRRRLSKVYGDLGGTSPNWVPSGLRATYSYDPVGNLAKVLYGPGTPFATTTYTYNSLNQLRFLTTKQGTTTNTICSFDYDDADNSSPGDNFTWPAARRLTTSGLRRGAREVIGTTPMRQVGYSYDPLKRLTREGLWSAAFASESSAVQYDAAAGYTDTAGYDKVGNRRGRTIVNSFPVVTGRTYSAYDSNDRPHRATAVNGQVSANFDANGNTLRYDVGADGAWDNAAADDVYDLENRLITAYRPAGTVSLVYDGDGNRVRKTVGSTTTYYLVDDRKPTGYAQVLEDLPSLSAWPLPTPTVRYVYGLDLLHQDQAGTLRYYGYDGLGSVRCLFSTSATVTDTYTYDAFGLLTARYARRSSDGVMVAFTDPASETSAPAGTTPVLNNYRYTGEQWDPDLGMYYLRVRYYHPDLGASGTWIRSRGTRAIPSACISTSMPPLIQSTTSIRVGISRSVRSTRSSTGSSQLASGR